jgi:hypothetical protein
MANITLRATKGSALTFQEADDNFTNLNNAKIESVNDDTAPTLGGNLDIGEFTINSSDGVITLANPVVVGGVALDTEDPTALYSLITGGAGATTILTTDDNNPLSPKVILSPEITTVGSEKPAEIIFNTDFSAGNPMVITQDTITVNSTLDVIGNVIVNSLNGLVYPYDNEDGTAGQVLTTDGAGNISFQSVSLEGAAFPAQLQLGTVSFGEEPDIQIFSAISGGNGATLALTTDEFSETAPVFAIGSDGSLTFFTGTETGLDISSDGVIQSPTIQNGSTDNLETVNGLFTSYREKQHGLGDMTGTLSIDTTNGPVQQGVLTGNITINSLADAVQGESRSVTLILQQDSTGGRTLTSSMKFAGGEKTLSTANGAIDVLTILWTGNTYLASLSKGFV